MLRLKKRKRYSQQWQVSLKLINSTKADIWIVIKAFEWQEVNSLAAIISLGILVNDATRSCPNATWCRRVDTQANIVRWSETYLSFDHANLGQPPPTWLLVIRPGVHLAANTQTRAILTKLPNHHSNPRWWQWKECSGAHLMYEYTALGSLYCSIKKRHSATFFIVIKEKEWIRFHIDFQQKAI